MIQIPSSYKFSKIISDVLNTPLLRKQQENSRILILAPGVIVFFLFANFLSPTFPSLTRGSFYFGTLIILGVIGLLIIILINWNSLKAHRHVLISSSLLATIFLVLTITSLVLDHQRVVFSDFIELIKPVMALLVFLSFFTAVNTLSGIRLIIKAYTVLFVLIALIGLFEAYFGLHYLTHILYTRPRGVLMGKAVSPFGITYFYASFMLFATSFYFSRFAVENRISIKTILLFFLCSFALLATQSRTLFLSYIAVIIYFITIYNFYPFPGKKRIFSTFAPFITFVVVIIIIYIDTLSSYFGYLYGGLSFLIRRGIDPTGDGSANIRIGQIFWSFENAKGYGIVGSGIGKGYQRLLESFYALYLYRYGIVGIALYIGIAITFLIKSYRAAKIAIKKRDSDLFAFFLALHLFVLVLPITSLSSVITDQFIFMMLYYGSFGLTLKYLYITNSGNRLQSAS